MRRQRGCQIEARLRRKPELGRHAEIAAKPDRRIRTDAATFANEVRYAVWSDANCSGELRPAHIERRQKFLSKDFAGMGGSVSGSWGS